MKEKLIQLVGKENVADDAETLASFAGDKSFSKSIEPRFVVKVKNAAQVQKLVKWANETKTPLVPVSSGSPHYRI